jgi:hypothetical protein
MKGSIVIGFLFFLWANAYVFAQVVTPLENKSTGKNQTILPDSIPLNGSGTMETIEVDRLIVDETITKAGYEFQGTFFHTLELAPCS